MPRLRLELAAATLLLFTSGAHAGGGAPSALQVAPDGRGVLISKDVGGARWSISRSPDGTATGNVFFPDGGPPAFVWCEEVGQAGGEVVLSCRGADRCDAAPCPPGLWSFLSEVTLPSEFFQPPGAGWRALAPLARGARQEHPTLAFAGEILVFGGFDGSGAIVASVEAYDPESDTWRSDIAPLPVPMHHANVAAVGGRIYVTGFLRELGFEPDGRVFEYDPETDRWQEREPMPAGSERGASGVAVIDGRIYVAGGLGGGARTAFSAYDPASDTWETLPDLPKPLDHLAAGAVDGIFYVLGGRSGSIAALSASVFAYDPETREWTARADMPTPRGGVAGAVLNGRIFVLGGEGNRAEGSAGVFPEVEAYDPASDTWEVLEPMALPRHGMGAAALGGRIYVPGGGVRQAFGPVAGVDALTPIR